MHANINPFLRVLFMYIESVFAVLGGFQSFVDPSGFLTMTFGPGVVKALGGVDATFVTVLARFIGSLFIVVGLALYLVFRSNNRDAILALLLAAGVGDILVLSIIIPLYTAQGWHVPFSYITVAFNASLFLGRAWVVKDMLWPKESSVMHKEE